MAEESARAKILHLVCQKAVVDTLVIETGGGLHSLLVRLVDKIA